MRIAIPLGSHNNSYHPKEKPKKSLTKVDTDVHPIRYNYKHDNFSIYKASAHPVIKSPQDRALWRRAVYLPHSPHSQPIPTPSSIQTCISPPQNIPPPHPVCLLCLGYLGDEYSYTTCRSCKANYAAPLRRVSDEDEYIDDFFSPSPSPQDENSDRPIMLLDGCIAKEKKSCFINDGKPCATLVLPSPSLTCSDDESEGCVTPSSCSSSVYSQDEFDLGRHLGYPTETNPHGSEPHLIDSTNRRVTPTLSTSSSVYSQDEDEIERVEPERRGWYDLPWTAGYFDDCQQSKGNGLEEDVEEGRSLAIDIHCK